VLERTVKLVTGFVHPVTNVCGVFPTVVILTSAFPALLKVNTLLAPELTRTLLMITGRGKLITPCGPPFTM
jgi:hypothetical protein